MKCLECGGELKIFDSRKEDDYVIRARYCKSCGRIFYTKEQFFNDQDEGYSQLRALIKKRRAAYWKKREDGGKKKTQKGSSLSSDSMSI